MGVKIPESHPDHPNYSSKSKSLNNKERIELIDRVIGPTKNIFSDEQDDIEFYTGDEIEGDPCEISEEVCKISSQIREEIFKKEAEKRAKKNKELKNRDTEVRIRISEYEKQIMQKKAESLGMKNLSEYIRLTSLNAQVSVSCDKDHPQYSYIKKYELSADKRGLIAYYYDKNSTNPEKDFYHIHSDELSLDQRIIYELLLRERLIELELS